VYSEYRKDVKKDIDELRSEMKTNFDATNECVDGLANDVRGCLHNQRAR
jgi:uncharacterized membrane-anchored protein YhcB (DUF1043 family)